MLEVTVIVTQHKTKTLLVQRHCQVKPFIINILTIHDGWLEEKLSV